MQMPINVKEVVDAATGYSESIDQAVSVSVYIDDSAPSDLVAHVRSSCASASPKTRITLSYIASGSPLASESDDAAIIVAGVGDFVGEAAARIRAAKTPVMVATTLPSLVEDLARFMGYPIPEGDIVSPATHGPATEASRSAVQRGADKARAYFSRKASGSCADDDAVAKGADAPADFAEQEEPYALDDQAASLLDRRMGEWIIEACAAKRLAMAHAFPFVRRPLAIETVNMTSVQNAGIGVVAFIPGADMPIMTLNQAKMLLQIAAAYGQPMSVARAKELACIVGGAFACRALARNAVGVVPAFGWLVKGLIGYTGTLAMGHAAIEYFENGGGAAGFAKTVSSASAAVARAAANVQKAPSKGVAPRAAFDGRQSDASSGAADALGKAGRAASGAVLRVAPVAAEAIGAGARSFAAGVGSLAKSASAMMGASKNEND